MENTQSEYISINTENINDLNVENSGYKNPLVKYYSEMMRKSYLSSKSDSYIPIGRIYYAILCSLIIAIVTTCFATGQMLYNESHINQLFTHSFYIKIQNFSLFVIVVQFLTYFLYRNYMHRILTRGNYKYNILTALYYWILAIALSIAAGLVSGYLYRFNASVPGSVLSVTSIQSFVCLACFCLEVLEYLYIMVHLYKAGKGMQDIRKLAKETMYISLAFLAICIVLSILFYYMTEKIAIFSFSRHIHYHVKNI
ncbi:hypothetical protein NEAUS03_1073 [Nematocida ausubeli]|nr:hypothetical protein NEAUS03_1073 [Nematocida ausubeli]